jgi:hypothetical protein
MACGFRDHARFFVKSGPPFPKSGDRQITDRQVADFRNQF